MPTTAGLVGTWLGTSGVAAAAATAVVGAYASKALAKAPESPKAPTPITQTKLQEKQAVNRSKLLERNASAAAGALSGNSSTLLTGSGGISPQSLSLGSSTLLGE